MITCKLLSTMLNTSAKPAKVQQSVIIGRRSFKKSRASNSMTTKKQNLPDLRSMRIPKNCMMVWIDRAKCSQISTAATSVDINYDVSILFDFTHDSSSHPFTIALRRPLSQPFHKSLPRIQKKIQSAIQSVNGGVSLSCNALSMQVEFEGVDISNMFLTNKDIFCNENMPSIQINKNTYQFVRNSADCVSIDIDLLPIAGFPLMAKYVLRSNCPKTIPKFFWFVGRENEDLPTPERYPEAGEHLLGDWQLRHVGSIFTPSRQDVGKRVCVLVDLGPAAIVRCVASNELISDAPDEELVFERRQADHCQEKAAHGCFRIMSYNILADLYLNLNFPQEQLFYPYCPVEFQRNNYRYSLILKELPGYNADIIFLQEVDERFHILYLPHMMKEYGYQCLFAKKQLSVSEGLVTLYRDSYFSLQATHDIWLTDLLNVDKFSVNRDVFELLMNDVELKENVEKKPAILQVSVLKLNSADETLIVAANTHLYFNPLYSKVKLIQALLCGRYVLQMTMKYIHERPNANIYYIFGGDFNATEEETAYRILNHGYISRENECWLTQDLHLQTQELFFGSVEGPAGHSYSSPFIDLTGNDVPTNYTRYVVDGVDKGFDGCLDHVWGSRNVQVEKIIPSPPVDLIRKYSALPSKIAPSDHLPILCDISFR